MKILFVANRVPYPPYRGDKLKIFNLASQLAEDHELHLITIAEDKQDLQYKGNLEPLFGQIQMVYLPSWKRKLNVIKSLWNGKPLQVSYFHSAKFATLLSKIDFNDYDAIHVQHLRMSQYFEKFVPQHAILDLPDAFSLYWKRRKENATHIFLKLFNGFEQKRLAKYENKMMPMFNLNLVCNEEDRAYFKLNIQGPVNVELLPNGVDTNTFKPNKAARIPYRVLFTGNMNYAPNVDGVQYFSSEIWPQVIKEIPNAQFIIAGQKPVASVLALASQNIHVTGFIEDLAAEYTKAQILVAPLRFGAGTQNKVLEAMASAIPVICTDIGFKGLRAEQGQGVFSTTSSSEFAQKLIELLKDDELCHNVGLQGFELIHKHFSWKSISSLLIEFFNNASKENK